jgi:hypothetical protein
MSGLSRARKIVLATAVVIAALGVFVATSGGSQSSDYSYQPATFKVAPHAGASGFTPGSYVSVASNIVALKGKHFVSGTLKCPADHPKSIAGQFSTASPDVFVSSSYRVANNRWQTQLTNTGSTKANTQIGVICSV